MTAHGIRIEQLLHAPQELEPSFEPHPRIVPQRLALLLIVVAVAASLMVGRGPVNAAAHAACGCRPCGSGAA